MLPKCAGDQDQGRAKHLAHALYMIGKNWTDESMRRLHYRKNSVANVLQLFLQLLLIVEECNHAFLLLPHLSFHLPAGEFRLI